MDAPTLRFLVHSQADSWEPSEELIIRGVKDITVVGMLPKLGKDIGLTARWTILQNLRRYRVRTEADARVR